MRPYLFRLAAANDIDRARNWYERQRPGLGDEFLSEVRRTMEAVLTGPAGFPVIRRETRRALVRRFPYGLFFRIVDDVIVFIACMHTSREPASWQRRR